MDGAGWPWVDGGCMGVHHTIGSSFVCTFLLNNNKSVDFQKAKCSHLYDEADGFEF